jgi:HlyD family secretion protein
MDRELTPRQRHSRWLAAAAKVLLALGVIAALGWSGRQLLLPSLDRTAIRTAVVERGSLEATVSATGTIVPRAQVTISSPVSAEIRAVHVSPGERVKAGQLIMALDTTASRLALSSLEEQLAVRRAEIRSIALQRDDAIRQARSRRDLLTIDLESRQVRLERFRQLADMGAVSASDFLEAQLDVRRTEVELEQIDADVLSLAARREADLERLELDYSIIEKQHADQARRVALSTVEATLAGVVTALVQDTGAVVVEGQALATIAADDAFRVDASVSDFYGPQLRLGQRARVRSSTSEFGGTLSRIVPIAESSRLDLVIELDDPAAPAFHTNLRVDVDIVTAERPDVLKVRRGPALEGAGIEQLFVIEGDRAVRRAVRLGVSERREIEIVEGLAVGDEVIVSDTSIHAQLEVIRIR